MANPLDFMKNGPLGMLFGFNRGANRKPKITPVSKVEANKLIVAAVDKAAARQPKPDPNVAAVASKVPALARALESLEGKVDRAMRSSAEQDRLILKRVNDLDDDAEKAAVEIYDTMGDVFAFMVLQDDRIPKKTAEGIAMMFKAADSKEEYLAATSQWINAKGDFVELIKESLPEHAAGLVLSYLNNQTNPTGSPVLRFDVLVRALSVALAGREGSARVMQWMTPIIATLPDMLGIPQDSSISEIVATPSSSDRLIVDVAFKTRALFATNNDVRARVKNAYGLLTPIAAVGAASHVKFDVASGNEWKAGDTATQKVSLKGAAALTAASKYRIDLEIETGAPAASTRTTRQYTVIAETPA